MNCELIQSQLTALLDGELPPDSAAEIERHLAACPGCVQIHAELLAARKMAAAWNVDAPETYARVMQAVAADDQSVLLDEVRLLRTEMAELRAAVAALRRRLSSRPETQWTLPSRDSSKDYPRMENDPWNLIRS